jgi:WD40 repeat protein
MCMSVIPDNMPAWAGTGPLYRYRYCAWQAHMCIASSYDVVGTGSADCRLLIWGYTLTDGLLGGRRSWGLVAARGGHSKPVTCVACFRSIAISGSADHTVQLWKTGTDERDYVYTTPCGHADAVTCLAVLSDEIVDSGQTGTESASGNLPAGRSESGEW